MISEYNFEILCHKYNLSKDNFFKKNSSILKQGKFQEIDATLNYLINDLNINVRNIEKCPSILYRDDKQIKENVNFIKSKSLSFPNIETCLHVFSTESNELKKTYDYVFKNYGHQAIEKITSILSVSVDIISDVESLNIGFTNPIGNLAVAVGVEFGSTSINEVSKILQSKEYEEHPELFTSQVLAQAKLENIQKILQSKEYQEHPELFTSTTLAKAKLEDIQKLLQLPYWNDEKYEKLLNPSVIANSKSMLKKLPNLIKLAEYYEIDEFINFCYLKSSPSQNFALINYLLENNIPLIVNNKLNSVFSITSGVLKKKHGIDLKVEMLKYDFSKFKFDEEIKIEGGKCGIR